jgi:hypothetical protein
MSKQHKKASIPKPVRNPDWSSLEDAVKQSMALASLMETRLCLGDPDVRAEFTGPEAAGLCGLVGMVNSRLYTSFDVAHNQWREMWL